MRLYKFIPNTLTTLNLISGCIGLIAIYKGSLYQGALFILIGSVFDFLDGFSARLLNAMSGIGKQLDSLSDLITFGLLPAFLMYFLFEPYDVQYLPLISLLLVVGSAFRLAKFNIDESQQMYFKGLPTPANAFLIAGLVFVKEAEWGFFSFIYGNVIGLSALTVVLSFLLNAPIIFLSFKIKQFKFKGNEYMVLLILVSLFCILFYGLPGILPATLFYVLLSLLHNLLIKKRLSGIQQS